MRVKQLIALIFLMLLGLGVAVPRSLAQQPVSTASKAERSAESSGSANSSTLLARMWRGTRAGFSLMTSSLMPTTGNTSTIAARFAFAPTALGPNLTVLGSGTVGRLTKWTGLTSSNSFIGNSTIFEDKNGNVGIGTDAPTSRLTVAGLIESTIGGFKFPDGTVQTTSAGGALFEVAHDATLTGNGTVGSPLAVSVPLNLTGSVHLHGVIHATNTAEFGTGVEANGGPSGSGIFALGGAGEGGHIAGDGVFALGGISASAKGGAGVFARGAFSEGRDGGDGVQARGGGSEGCSQIVTGASG